MCHLTRTSYISPNKVPEFLDSTELFWLYNSGLDGEDSSELAAASAASSFSSKNSCVFFLDGCVNKNKLKELIRNRIIESPVHDDKFERFTQRVLNLRSLGFVWIRCSTFDLDEHIVEIDSSIDFESNEEIQV